MEKLPLVLEDLILDYKHQLEHVDKFKKTLEKIKLHRTGILNPSYELSTDRTGLIYIWEQKCIFENQKYKQLMIGYTDHEFGKKYRTFSDIL